MTTQVESATSGQFRAVASSGGGGWPGRDGEEVEGELDDLQPDLVLGGVVQGKKAWTPAYDADHTERPGAWAAEITDMPDLSTWPTGMRLIARKERPVRREALSIRTEVKDLRR